MVNTTEYSHNKCGHTNTILAYYHFTEGVERVQSLYVRYCTDCGNFVNILSGEIVFDNELKARFLW